MSALSELAPGRLCEWRVGPFDLGLVHTSTYSPSPSYAIYGPQGVGILYVPIGRVRQLFNNHYHATKPIALICREMTEDLLAEAHQRQFETILTDATAVPAYSHWFT